jgi:hypothetical protein
MACNMWFWDYAQDVHALNIILCGIPSHLAETALRNQLEAGLESALQAKCACEELYKITLLKELIEQVWKIDECLTSKRKQYHEVFVEESNLHVNKRPALGTSRVFNTTHNGQTSSSSSQKPFVKQKRRPDWELNPGPSRHIPDALTTELSGLTRQVSLTC